MSLVAELYLEAVIVTELEQDFEQSLSAHGQRMLLADRILPQDHIFKAFDAVAVFAEDDELNTELLGSFQFGTEPLDVRLGTVCRQLLKVVLSVDDFPSIIETHIVTDRERIGNPYDTVRIKILYNRSDHSSFLTAVYDDFHLIRTAARRLRHRAEVGKSRMRPSSGSGTRHC